MKNLTCVGLAAFLAAAAAAQERHQPVHSAPEVPPREALDRLNLRLAWSAFVHTEGARDGLVSVQLDGRLLLVQTRSGLVTAIEAETGQTRWRTRVGRNYRSPLPLAFNRKAVFVINGMTLYSLDRGTGATQWEFALPTGVSAPPAAGDYQVYIGFGTSRLSAYLLPQLNLPGEAELSAEMARYVSGEEQAAGYPPGTFAKGPVRSWDILTRAALEWAPVSGPKGLLFAAPDGEVFSMEKFPLASREATELFRHRLTEGAILAPPGGYEEMAYIGSKDTNVYAVHTETGRTAWRFTAGAPIQRQPIATEKDVYVVAENRGLARLDRATGEPLWRLPFAGMTYPSNRLADRFLAANPKFVYATDPSGRLVVLDRATGTHLSTYPGTRDFTEPLSNAVNDRIYLAANNGLIVCLHDRDYPTPYRHTRQGEAAVDPRVAEVEAKLTKPVSDPGSEAQPLERVLKALLGEKNGNIKYRLADNAFKEAGIADVASRLATIPQVNGVPLGTVLRKVLLEVDATYRIVEDTVLIYPAPKKPST